MTTLEIILLLTLWIIYGVFSAYQEEETNSDYTIGTYIMYIIFAPIVLIYRILIGIFHPKTMN
jgi:hypothetical protein